MDPKYLYLSLDLSSLLLPLLFSFYAPANFSKKWKHLWVAIAIPGICFLLWDEFFTRIGVWGFNKTYLTGLYVGNLPVEEILFFICIPYACVFTYEALKYLIQKDYLLPYQKLISISLIFILTIMGLLHLNKWYTSTTFLGLATCLAIMQFSMKVNFLSRIYFSYLFILVPFFTINGVLTGSMIADPVVWYNDFYNLGIRLGTIPLEDIFYGMLLFLLNVSIFESLQRNSIQKS